MVTQVINNEETFKASVLMILCTTIPQRTLRCHSWQNICFYFRIIV